MGVFLWTAVKPFIFYWRCFGISNVKHQINEAIKDREVRLIDEDGSQLGIMPVKDAQKIALNKGLDLCEDCPAG